MLAGEKKWKQIIIETLYDVIDRPDVFTLDFKNPAATLQRARWRGKYDEI